MHWYGGGVACSANPEPGKEAKTFTISFDVEGVDAITVKEGETAESQKPADPTEDGYSFECWQNGDAAYDWTQPVTSDLSLTAKWTLAEYTITYLPEGVVTDNPTTYNIESDTITLNDPTTCPSATPNFLEWRLNDENGAVVTEIAKGSTGNKIIYANCTAKNVYKVTFKLGKEVIGKGKNVIDGNKLTDFTGYEKYDYYSDAECNNLFKFTETPITSNITVYLKVKSLKVTLTIAEGVSADLYVNYGEKITQTLLESMESKIPEEYKSYVFKGLFEDAAFTKEFKWAETEITAAKTLYVKLIPTYTITFDSKDGSAVSAITGIESGTVTTKPNDPTKEGYIFDGWLNGETAYDWTQPVTSNLTLTAKWLKLYTVKFMDGETELSKIIVADGKVASKPGLFTVDAKKGTGITKWIDSENKEFDFSTPITADLELTAKWEATTSLWAPKDTAEKEVSCTMPGYQFAVSYEENETYGKVLVLSNKSDVGTYDKMTLTFKNPKNLSGKLLKFDLWGDAEDKEPKVLIISGDKAQSEGYAPQIHTANAWGTGTTILDECNAAWSSDNSIAAADLTAVTSIQIAFQNAAANMKYGKIYITDAEGANEEILWTANALSVEDPASWTNATVSYVEDATYGSVYKVETTSEVNYPITNVAFPSPAKDFSAYEYLQITLKASAAPASDNEKIKVSIFTDGTHASEHNGCNIVAEDVDKWKSFSLKLEDFWAAWSSDNSIEKADLSKISNLKIEFGKYVGTVEIGEISLY
ncbi:MAG: InlB B-repeat-containing protein [Treponema sp.]|nr:InlB B-repeat-containing protein [Treponema sp.]